MPPAACKAYKIILYFSALVNFFSDYFEVQAPGKRELYLSIMSRSAVIA